MTLSRHTVNYLYKLILYGAIVTLCIFAIMVCPDYFKLLPQLILGAMFAHGIELEHEMIHQRHFGKRWANAIGFLLGLPMFVEFTRYYFTHSYHHRAVGTLDDEESFSYNVGLLGAPLSFVWHLSMLNYWGNVFKNLCYALMGNSDAIRHNMGKSGETAPEPAIQLVLRGYRVMGGILLGAIIFSLFFHATLFLQIWLVPLVFASPIHILLELPEHWQCDIDSTDIMSNTRTILPSRFADWFTNGNCWHVEHHYKPAIPMGDLPQLHEEIASQIKFFNFGYCKFYQEFFIALFKSEFDRSLSI